MEFTKTAKKIADQVALLKQRGLNIEDERKAVHHLSTISYYRLSAYLLSFQKFGDSSHSYMPWGTFERVMDLYRFDKELRIIALDAIERIEIAIRCRIVYEFCVRYGNNWYEDERFYIRSHPKIMKKVYEELKRSKELFIDHYYKKYTVPTHPAAWMAIEVLSFAQLSILFKNLHSNEAKKAVAKYFGVGVSVLESWIEHLVYIRNLCAHHSRLWNRTLTITPTIPRKPQRQWITITPTKSDKIYTSLCIIAYLLKVVAPESYFKGKLKTLVERLPQVDIKSAGFPNNWPKDIFWKNIHMSYTYRIRSFCFILRNQMCRKPKRA